MRLSRLRDDESGMSMVFVGMGFMAFMAATTLAIDVGMMMTARSQAQNSADAAALAGAVALGYNNYTDRSASGPAVTSAIAAGKMNSVMGGTVSILPADVTFPADPAGNPSRVQATVYRTADRYVENVSAGSIPTLIGGLFGVNTVDVSATAIAEVSAANAETCVKPFMIPDKWTENVDKNGTPDGPWTPDSNFNYYDSHHNVLPNHDVYIPPGQPGYTGYSAADYGKLLVLRAGTGNNIEPTMYYSWKMPGDDIGADFYRDNIAGCNQTVIQLSATDPFYMIQEPGDMTGPTNQGIDDLIAKDPGARFEAGCNCVKGSAFGTSPRITPIPLYDPQYYADNKENGRGADFRLANVMGFFIDHRSGNQVYGYIMPIGGIAKGGTPAPTGVLPIAIKLVQ